MKNHIQLVLFLQTQFYLSMGRNKKEIDDKKKNISLSINNDIFDKIDEYTKLNNLNKSELVEKLWIEFIESKNKI